MSCGGKWKIENGTDKLSLTYEDANSNEYTCEKQNSIKIFVKFRTCDNCIELDPSTVSGILVGDLVATVLIGVAVYFIASQPKGKQVYRGSKASDRQNLIQNQQNDTYQPLTQGHSSEYSQLEKRKR
ncbi:T-cell surface glycoprotein CD3 gamma chain-like [Megalops cyprinoides]|uniref:T-cell surface glycoprotein CD3 gamma chain-like n=1 Tax=Megalops cyprinoides TaxID=118141 RepID=UPI001863BA6F|nr:T-cell surface glycoprotein CD3 gamma chain-like [Megalops cyprinoides]